jgi:hypothetical protein
VARGGARCYGLVRYGRQVQHWDWSLCKVTETPGGDFCYLCGSLFTDHGHHSRPGLSPLTADYRSSPPRALATHHRRSLFTSSGSRYSPAGANGLPTLDIKQPLPSNLQPTSTPRGSAASSFDCDNTRTSLPSWTPFASICSSRYLALRPFFSRS